MPSVALVTQEFVTLARRTADGLGFDDLPLVVLPHPFETLPENLIRKLAEDHVDAIISKLVAPVTVP